MRSIETKREREKAMVSEMIALYCRRNHHAKSLCPDCAALADYARQHSDRCPFMESKTFCSNCGVHCYAPEMREKIRAVMRFSGPRMLFHHPVMAARHLIETKREKTIGVPGMKIKKACYIALGCVGVGLGALGAVLPLLPAFPFLLLAAFCFGRSSEKLNRWFTETKLYRDNLESYVKGRGRTKKTKVRIMITVTILMSVGFVMMHAVPVGRIVLGCVWVFHIVYFSLGVKTLPAAGRAE